MKTNPALHLALRKACFAGLAAAATLATGHAATFRGLGGLDGGPSFPFAVSADGSVIVGQSYGANGKEAFRWTAAGGMAGLGDLAGGDFGSVATGVSADGTVIVGWGTTVNGHDAFRLVVGGPMVGLGDLAGGTFYSIALAVSADGKVVVGYSDSGKSEAFRWMNAIAGLTGLGEIEAVAMPESVANAVSADGGVIVGQSHSAKGWQAFRWTASGMEGIGAFDASNFYSTATGVSADGSVIVGYSNGANGNEAFRWAFSGFGMEGLGDLPGGSFYSYATGVSADGEIVVGQSTGENGDEAFVWDAAHGMRSIPGLLAAAGIDLAGWTLGNATAISADGKVVVGIGTHDGHDEAWRATLEPAAPQPKPAAPVVKITGAKKLTTAKAKVTIRGKATGEVTSITAKLGKKTVKARGTASWSLKAPLKPGRNVLTVTAHGPGGASAPARLTITRKP